MNWYLKVLKQYGDCSGRARRKEFWMFILFNTIIVMILGFIEGVADINPTSDDSILGSCYQLAILIPSIAVGVRRLHDVGKSGWMMIIVFIPLIGAIWLIVLMVTDSNPGVNEYGANPKEIAV